MSDDLSSRLSGAFLLVLAMVGTSWMELRFHRDGAYSVEMALIMPLAAAVGLDLLLHAPKIPVEVMTARSGFYVALGSLVGLFNLHRFGAFSEDSSVRTPLFIGIGFAWLYFGFEQLRQRFRR